LKNTTLKIAITGANGLIGRNLRKFLNYKKIKLISIARCDFATYPSETKIITNNLNDEKLVSFLLNCDALVHLIGVGKQSFENEYQVTNVDLTRKVIQLCRKAKIKKIIFLSGLGASKKSTTHYFISKHLAEKEIKNSKLDYTIFRPSYIIGKDDQLSKNLKKQAKKGLVTIPGSGKYLIQPIFVKDVCKVIFMAILSHKFCNKVLDLVGPEITSFEKYVKQLIGPSKIKIKKIPLEKVLHDAIHNNQTNFSIDDLHILLGSFQGNFQQLQNLSGLKFTSYREVLKASHLS
jgi:NADH dehydrogenase